MHHPALFDSRLSFRARGIAALFIAEGRVLPAHELVKLTTEGRDSIRKAVNELKDLGYLQQRRYQVNGRWRTDAWLTDAWSTEAGFSGPLYSCTGGTVDISDIAIQLDSSKVLAGCTYVQPSNTAGNLLNSKPSEIDTEEFIPMPWPGLDHEDTPRAEGEVGAIGKIEDKAAIRQAKYKKTKFEAVPERMRRDERPEELWTTEDLVAEFYDLTRENAPGVPGQINGRGLATWLNAKVGEGVPRIALLRGIRAFFSDPRVFRDAGVGTPLWRRFLAFYPTIHGKVISVPISPVDDDLLAASAKALLEMED